MLKDRNHVDTDETLVNIQLTDFKTEFPSRMLEKFKTKRPKSFSNLNVEQIDNIYRFKHPFDVKICHTLQCIIVSDHGLDRIQFLCLWKGTFIKSVKLPSTPVYIDVVENDTNVVGSNSLIISCCNGHVYKYSLLEMMNLKTDDELLNYIWKSQLFDGPAGLQRHGNIIYFCDPYQKFSILSLMDGKVLEEIDFGFCVWNVQVINEFTLALTDQDEDSLSIVKKINENEWKTINKILFKDFFYALYDKVSNNLIITSTKSIKVIDVHGNLESTTDITQFQQYHQLDNSTNYVGGCTLDYNTGYLYFADYTFNCLRIFKSNHDIS